MSELQRDPSVIRWRLHLRTSPSDVYRLLAEDKGRARFWADLLWSGMARSTGDFERSRSTRHLPTRLLQLEPVVLRKGVSECRSRTTR